MPKYEIIDNVDMIEWDLVQIWYIIKFSNWKEVRIYDYEDTIESVKKVLKTLWYLSNHK